MMKGFVLIFAMTFAAIAIFLLVSALYPDSGRSPKPSSPYLHGR